MIVKTGLLLVLAAVLRVAVPTTGDLINAELSNAQQSSTDCSSHGTCYPVSLAIDGGTYTYSRTKWTTGTHWLRVSMSLLTVHQVVLSAGTMTGNEDITVSLYKGGALTGHCDTYTGYLTTLTLRCDKVQADMVKLSATSTRTTYLGVWDIKVRGVVTTTRAKKMSSSSTQLGGKGETVVDEVTQSVEKVLGDTKGFLKKIAYVESRFGEHYKTYRSEYYGGIFQMDYSGFIDTQDTGSHPGLKAKHGKIQAAWGIDWTKTRWSEMRKPLYSAIAARLKLSNVLGAIPSSLDGQANYWKKHYNSKSRKSSAAKFEKRWNYYLAKKSVDMTKKCGMRTPPLTRIFGGSETGAGNYPWNVFIQLTGGKFCGGSLVNEDWVMTAGHCFVKRTDDNCDGDCIFIDPSDIIAIKAGVHSRTSKTEAWQVRTATSITVHPKFKMQANIPDFDVGLIRVNIPFEYNKRVNRVCLSRNGNFVTNQFLTITGWGRTNKRYKSYSDVLQKVDVPYVPHDVCNSDISYKGVITDTMFCAGFQVGRKDACEGDSGGPIVYRGTNGAFIQGGIVSWGKGCGQENFYGVYTNLARFYDWIMLLIVKN